MKHSSSLNNTQRLEICLHKRVRERVGQGSVVRIGYQRAGIQSWSNVCVTRTHAAVAVRSDLLQEKVCAVT